MNDTKKGYNILKILFIVLIAIDTLLVFLRFPYKKYVILGVYVLSVIIFFIMKSYKEKLKQSKIGGFKKFMNGFHIVFTAFVILLALFLMLTRG